MLNDVKISPPPIYFSFYSYIPSSQSFPLFLPSLPGFTSYGAYSEEQVYTPDQVKQIVDYARAQGVQVNL